jgi:type IX secretion system PorP/SprF family membrane protein
LFVKGQDIQFSQIYQAQLFQNPAFAGSAHLSRFSAHQRMQWPALDATYVTSMASYDTYLRKYSSGWGLTAIYDRQSSSTMQSYQVAGQYSYEVHLTSFISLRYGLEMGLHMKSLDYLKLTFPEQYDDLLGLVGTNPFAGQQNKIHFDASTGGIFYSNEGWVGFSLHHINKPNQSYLGDVAVLPRKFSVTSGYKFIIHEKRTGVAHEENGLNEFSVTPTLHYKAQGKSDQFDLGLYGQYYQIVGGVWYRGIPFKTEGIYGNNESFAFLAGYHLYNMSFTYSYDWVLSSLRRANPYGAHEINVTYYFRQKKWTKPTKKVPCPTFYR